MLKRHVEHNEPRHEKSCLCHMRTTKAQISLRSLISAFIVHFLDNIIPLVSIPEILSLYIASVAAQAGLSLPWSQTPEDRFSRDEAVIILASAISSWTDKSGQTV